MKRSRTAAGRVGAVLLAIAAAAPVAGAATPPELRLEAPPELADTARRVEAFDREPLVAVAEVVGLAQPGPPIRVLLAPESAEVARSTPAWISGFAYGALGTVVLFPERVPAYPTGSLEELLRHEVCHVLVARAAGGRDVPRWFNEGIAMMASDSWSLEDRSQLAWALVVGGSPSLAEVDAAFGGDRGDVRAAYAVSGALVRFLFQSFGRDVAAGVLGHLALGLEFEEAFRRVTAVDLERVVDTFWRRHSLWYRWLPILSSSLTLWAGIALLAVAAARQKRRRRAAIEARWEAEEARAAAAALERLPEPPASADQSDRWLM